MTIWKFPLAEIHEQTIAMPENATILSVQVQPKRGWGSRGEICMWALVDPHAPLQERRFLIYGTGQAIFGWEKEYQFVATVQLDSFVWHIFEHLGEGQ